MLINVEEYASSLFRSWTDGPKYILEFVGNGRFIESTNGDIDVTGLAAWLNFRTIAGLVNHINDRKLIVSTFYVVCSPKVFLNIASRCPNADVRLLLLPE